MLVVSFSLFLYVFYHNNDNKTTIVRRSNMVRVTRAPANKVHYWLYAFIFGDTQVEMAKGENDLV